MENSGDLIPGALFSGNSISSELPNSRGISRRVLGSNSHFYCEEKCREIGNLKITWQGLSAWCLFKWGGENEDYGEMKWESKDGAA